MRADASPFATKRPRASSASETRARARDGAARDASPRRDDASTEDATTPRRIEHEMKENARRERVPTPATDDRCCASEMAAFIARCDACFAKRPAGGSHGVDHVAAAIIACDEKVRKYLPACMMDVSRAGECSPERVLQSLEYFEAEHRDRPYDAVQAMRWSTVKPGNERIFARAYEDWVAWDTAGFGTDDLARDVFYPAVAFTLLFDRMVEGVPKYWEPIFSFLRSKMRSGAMVQPACTFNRIFVDLEKAAGPKEFKYLYMQRVAIWKYMDDFKWAKFTERHMTMAMRNRDVTGMQFLHQGVGLPLDHARADEHLARSIKKLGLEDLESFQYMMQFGLAEGRSFEEFKAFFLKSLAEHDAFKSGRKLKASEASRAHDMARGICMILPDDHTETKSDIRAIGEIIDAHKEDMREGEYIGAMKFLQNSYNALDVELSPNRREARERDFHNAIEDVIAGRVETEDPNDRFAFRDFGFIHF